MNRDELRKEIELALKFGPGTSMYECAQVMLAEMDALDVAVEALQKLADQASGNAMNTSKSDAMAAWADASLRQIAALRNPTRQGGG